MTPGIDLEAIARGLTRQEVRLLLEMAGFNVLHPVGSATATVAAESLKGRRLITVENHEGANGRVTVHRYRLTEDGQAIADKLAQESRIL